jgi:phage tail tape-measure protein
MAYPDPWSTPTQPLSSPLYTNPTAGANALAERALIEQLKKQAAAGNEFAKAKLAKLGEVASSAGEAVLGVAKNIPKRAIVGGGAVLAGVPALMQGDLAGAAGSSAGAVIGGVLGAPLGPIGSAVGTTIGAMAGGALVGGTKAALEKTPQAVSIPTPFGDLPLNASAQQMKYMQQLSELGLTQERNALQTRVSATIDLTKKLNDEDLRARQAGFSILQAEQNADLTRAQALINSQNNAYQQQMILGGAINQTIEAQRERGAFMRQAIATNPYVTALAAPSIGIG